MNRLLAALLLLLPLCAAAQDDTKKEEQPKQQNNPIVLLKTSKGDITLELFADQAPLTVKNFLALAEGTKEWTDPRTGQKVKRPFYDGLVFHRVIKGFMIQGGCPLGNGQSGPGYSFADEISAKSLGLDKQKVLDEQGRPHPHLGIRSKQQWGQQVFGPLCRKLGITSNQQLQARQEEVKQKLQALTFQQCFENLGYKYDDKLRSSPPVKGVIAMANMGPNTNGSQFFINLIDTPWLKGKHTVFGRVTKGMELVEQIGEVAVDGASRPETPVQIVSIRLVK